jgi:hypothetical protein
VVGDDVGKRLLPIAVRRLLHCHLLAQRCGHLTDDIREVVLGNCVNNLLDERVLVL